MTPSSCCGRTRWPVVAASVRITPPLWVPTRARTTGCTMPCALSGAGAVVATADGSLAAVGGALDEPDRSPTNMPVPTSTTTRPASHVIGRLYQRPAAPRRAAGRAGRHHLRIFDVAFLEHHQADRGHGNGKQD